jgi:Putative lactococcus lactis phage r1t holin
VLISTKQFLLDTVERVVRTFIQAVLAYWSVVQIDALSWDTGRAMLGGSIAAGISAVMAVLSKNIGAKDSAGVLSAGDPNGLGALD